MKIRNKFLIPTILFSSIFFIIFGIYISYIFYKVKNESFDSYIHYVSSSYPTSIVNLLWNYDTEAVIDTTESIFADNEIYSIEVISNGDKIFSKSKMYESNVGERREVEFPLKKDDLEIGKITIVYTNQIIIKQYLDIITKLTISYFLIITIIFLTTITVSKIVVSPITKITDFAKSLKEGDFTRKIYVDTKDELQDIAHSFNTNIDNIKNVLNSIKESSNSILETSKEITEGNNHLSENINSQAASIEQTNTSMEAVYEIITKNIEKTKTLNSLTQNMTEIIKETGERSDVLKQSMDDITESAKKIDKIINIIDDIAFQTNLLSLNAAVESARAQTTGRGFSVVTEKIRKLANRSSRSAKEIKSLIVESQQNIAKGQNFVTETSKKMDEIVQETQIVAENISSIHEANDSELTSLTQVKEATSQLNDITQSNAELAEDTQLISKSLENEIRNFSKIFTYFKIDNE